MYKNIGEVFIFDEIVYENFEFEKKYKNKILDSENIVYEVFRVIKNKPLFLSEHLERLKNSLEKSNINYDIQKVEFFVYKLINLNKKIKNNNIKIAISKVNNKTHLIIYFVESFYPDISYYENGINTKTYKYIRKNPLVKSFNYEYKNKIKELMDGGYFEILLVNENDEVIEGSKSNLFFIYRDTVLIPELDGVLKGVTLMAVLKIIKENKIKYEFKNVKSYEIKDCDCAFITGNSIDIMPIRYINGNEFDIKNEILKKIMLGYQLKVKEDLDGK